MRSTSMQRVERFVIVALATIMAGSSTDAADPGQGVTLRGRVLNEPGGQGVAEVVVTLWDGSSIPQRRTARTDAAGAYAFDGVGPGDCYKVWIETRPGREAGVWSEGAVVVKVGEQPVQAADLFLKWPQSVSGTVVDLDTEQPVPGVELNFSTSDRNYGMITTDHAGRYQLFVTSREVEIGCNGTADRYYAIRDPQNPKEKIQVPPGQHVTPVDFEVRSAPRFTGSVTYPDGQPAKNLDLLVRFHWRYVDWLSSRGPGGGNTVSLRTDELGRFVGYCRAPPLIDEQMEANIELKAIARLPDGSMGGVARAKTDTSQRHIDSLHVLLEKTASIEVRVLDLDNQPVTQAKVTASDTYPGMYVEWGGRVKHLGEGRYVMDQLVLGLDYYLEVGAPGHRTWNAGPIPVLDPYKNAVILQPSEARRLDDVRLEWWGKKAVPDLLEKLRNAEPSKQEYVAMMLGKFGPDAAEAVPALVEMLKKSPLNTARYSAAAALGEIGPAAKTAVSDLIHALQADSEDSVQRNAATALGRIGDPAALPALRKALQHHDRDVKKAAEEAIAFLGVHRIFPARVILRRADQPPDSYHAELWPFEGVIVDPGGVVLTSRQLIRDAQELEATLADGRHLRSQAIVSDTDTDIAIVRLATDDKLPAAEWSVEKNLQVGVPVTAIALHGDLGTCLVGRGLVAARLDQKPGTTEPPRLRLDSSRSTDLGIAIMLDEEGRIAAFADRPVHGSANLSSMIRCDRVEEIVKRLAHSKNAP